MGIRGNFLTRAQLGHCDHGAGIALVPHRLDVEKKRERPPDAAQGVEGPEAHSGVVGARDQEGGPHRQRQHRLIVPLQHLHALQGLRVPHPACVHNCQHVHLACSLNMWT